MSEEILAGSTEPALFTQSERCIFRYFDGEKARATDPLKVFRDLRSYPELDFKADIEAMKAEDVSAEKRIINAARQAIGAKDFEEVEGKPIGLLDHEVLSVVYRLMSLLADLQKKLSNTQTSPSGTGAESSGVDSTIQPS